MTDVAALTARLGSPDVNDRMLATGELVQLGPAAVPGLVEVLRDPSAPGRALAAEALAEIADPAAADHLAGAVDDPDEGVRAHAAVGLVRLGDPRAAAALVRTIDDRQDVLHYPYTSSVYGLIALGAPALPAIAPLLDASSPVTRERAFLVLRSVVEAMPASDAWQPLWERLGRYDPHAEGQDAAAAQWREWIAAQA
jgi:HEAT repeat protein